MVHYSINDLEKITGIKAHTLRIWEKRYDIVSPDRTATNFRLYSDEDLKRLLNISFLNRYGYKISFISKLSSGELNELVRKIAEDVTDQESQLENLMVAMIELDENKFDKILSSAIIKMGFENTITRIIFPFLEKIGLLWQIGSINPAHEHFITHLIRQKLIIAIDGALPPKISDPKTFILFLPPDEFHELSLLYYYYILKLLGHSVIYLGQSIPIKHLDTVTQIRPVDYVLTAITSSLSSQDYINLISILSGEFRQQTVFITGYQVREHDIAMPPNVIRIDGADQLKQLLGST